MKQQNILSKLFKLGVGLAIGVTLTLTGCGGGGGGAAGGNGTGGGGTVASPQAITSFAISSPAVTGTINESAKTISLTVPSGINVTSLVATFTTTGVSVKVGSVVQSSGATPNDFTNPVIYTVTGLDSTATQYTVTVTVTGISTKALTSYSLLGFAGTIDEAAKTISVNLPANANVKALVATFTTSGATVQVGSTTQVSGTTANDFSGPVIYTVTAANGTTAQYTVTVTATGTARYISLSNSSVSVDLPSVITLFFQAKDISGNYVTTLTNSDFTLLEDGAALAPSESFQEIVPSSQLPYTQYTVLLIDISSSINASDLANMKVAAKNMVANMVNHQQIAIYTFDDRFTRVSAFSKDQVALSAAIDTIAIGNPSTNLYGAVQSALALWTDSATVSGIVEGSLIVITDGSDTAAVSTLNATTAARGTKNVFTIGAGAFADNAALTSLASNSANFLPISNYSLLQSTLTQVSAKLAAQASSYYYLHYATPKRSGSHSLTLQVASNTNTAADATITKPFNANGFSSITPLTSFAITPTLASIFPGNTQQFTATGTLANATTQDLTSLSSWNSSDIAIATVGNVTGSKGLGNGITKGTVTITVTAPAANMFKFATATLIVTDVPTIPANLVTSVNATQVNLSWTASTDNIAVTGYKIYRDGANISTVTGTTATDTGLPNVNYCYTVSAIDGSGNESAQSVRSCALTTNDPPPSVPTGLSIVSGGATALSLTWSASTDNFGVTGYKIYRDGTYLKTVTVTTALDTGLVTGTNYCYSVSAIDTGNNESAQSAQVCASTVLHQYAYVANSGSNNISVYTIDPVTGTLIAGTAVVAGGGPNSVTVDPSGKFAYAANSGGNSILAYTINRVTGTLTAGTAVAAGSGPFSVTVDPAGRFAYMSIWAGGVYVFAIDPVTGALTLASSAASGLAPISVVVDPTGKFLYAANRDSNNISVYTINSVTGALTAGTAVAAGTTPYSVTVDPTGKFAYAANRTSNNISVYTIDPVTGALTAGTAVAAGTTPSSVTVDPTGKFAYVSNSTSNTVSAYTINPVTGALTAGTVVAAGINPISVTVDPTGKFAYVANQGSNNISVYAINSFTGALTAGTAVATGAAPVSVVTTKPM